MTNEEILKILDAISVKDDGVWFRKMQWREDNEFWLKKLVPIIIKVLRKMRFENISSEDVANLIGLPSEDFKNFITGRYCNISFKTLCLIEDFLEIQIIKDL